MEIYPHAPGAKTGGPSEDAAAEMAPVVPTLREIALTVLQAADTGLTADEVADVVGLSVLSIRPRITELSRLGLIEPTQQRRRNKSGKKATVWRKKWKTDLFN